MATLESRVSNLEAIYPTLATKDDFAQLVSILGGMDK